MQFAFRRGAPGVRRQRRSTHKESKRLRAKREVWELQGFRQVEGGRSRSQLHRNPGARLNINSVLNGYISNAGTTCIYTRHTRAEVQEKEREREKTKKGIQEACTSVGRYGLDLLLGFT